MDHHSILKLLEDEEEEDKDESILSMDDVDAFQASLIREIEGGNDSSSQQFAVQNSGFEDANTMTLHILESTQMKEQQQSVLGNQDQEFKPENDSHLQHNPPHDHRQLCENPSHVPQASNLQSTEPERPQPQCLKLQNMSQRTHGVEHHVGSVNHHGPAKFHVRDLIRVVLPQVDKDSGKQILNLLSKCERKEITKVRFFRQVEAVLGVHMTRLVISQMKQGNKGIRVPGGPNHYSESFTSAEISAKKSDTCGVHVSQLPSISLGTLSSSATVKGLHNLEKPTSVNAPSMVQGGPIVHFQNNSSLPLYSAPCQVSVTKDQTVSPSSSVVHVKQKLTDQSFDQVRKPCSLVQKDVSNIPMKQNSGNPRRSNDDLETQSYKMGLPTSITHANMASPSMTTQLDSRTMVNFAASSGTIPAGSNVRTTPNMSSVGQKKPLEARGSSLPPSSKKQKLCGTALTRSDKQFNDVTALSGIDLDEERELLSSQSEKDSRVLESFRRVAQEEEGRTILQKVPLKRKLAEIMARSGLKHINDDVERCLSLCVEERMRGLLSSIIRMSKQRTDAEKCRNRICITSDIRKQINEINQRAKEEWERKHGGEEKLKNEENDTAKEDNHSEQVKANKKEQDEWRTKAANAAALASVGGENAFSKWKLMAEARQKPWSGPGGNSEKPSGGIKFGKKQGSPKVVRSISVKDVIAVVEKEPQMSRSTLLYRLYNRIVSDVPTQEK